MGKPLGVHDPTHTHTPKAYVPLGGYPGVGQEETYKGTSRDLQGFQVPPRVQGRGTVAQKTVPMFGCFEVIGSYHNNHVT